MEENIKFFLRDLKASNYNLSFIESVENLIKENKELKEEKNELNNAFYNSVSNSKIQNRITELEEILQSTIIKEDYKKEVQGRIWELKDLLEEE